MEENSADPNLQFTSMQDTAWTDDVPCCMMSNEDVQQLDPNSFFDPIVDQCNRPFQDDQQQPCRRVDPWEEDDGCIDDYSPATFRSGSLEARQQLNNVPTPQYLSLDVLEDPSDRVPIESIGSMAWNRNGSRNPFSIWDRPW